MVDYENFKTKITNAKNIPVTVAIADLTDTMLKMKKKLDSSAKRKSLWDIVCKVVKAQRVAAFCKHTEQTNSPKQQIWRLLKES